MGGAQLTDFGRRHAKNSLVRNAETFGLLKLTLEQDSYKWKFVGPSSSTFDDSGSADCH